MWQEFKVVAQAGGQWGTKGCPFVLIFFSESQRWCHKTLASGLLALAAKFSWRYLHSRYIQLYVHHHWSVWANEIFHLFTGKENPLEWKSLLAWNIILNFNVKRNKKTPSSCFFHYGLITKYKPAFPLLLK